MTKKERDTQGSIHRFLRPNVTITLRVDKLEEPLFTQLLKVGADILTLHAEMRGDFLNALETICRQVDLGTSDAVIENLLYLGEVLRSFRPKSECVCLFDRINFVFNLGQSIENLLVTI